MIKFDKKLTASRYSKEASELNNLVIKLKREVLKGTVTTISLEEIDEATIPVLDALLDQKQPNNYSEA